MQEGSEGRDGADEERVRSEEENRRPQQGGEAGTTRFGMEDGDSTDVAATGGVGSDQDPPAPPE